MSILPKVKKQNLMRPWLSANVDCKDGRFIQVGNSFLLSKRVQTLSTGARITYLCMAMESAGKQTFEFPKTAAEKYGIPVASFRRYVDELVAGGYIHRVSGRASQQPNQYRFSTERWKNV